MSIGETRSVIPLPSPPKRSRSTRRSVFRQRFIDAETGLRLLFRADGTLFFHSFIACGVVTAGIILGLSLLEWALIFVCFSMVVFAELIRLIAERFASTIDSQTPDIADSVEITSPAHPGEEITRLATTGTILTSLCSALIITLLLGSRLWSLFVDAG